MSEKTNIVINMRDGEQKRISNPDSFGFTNGFLEVDYEDKIDFIAADLIAGINVEGVTYESESMNEGTHAAHKIIQ